MENNEEQSIPKNEGSNNFILKISFGILWIYLNGLFIFLFGLNLVFVTRFLEPKRKKSGFFKRLRRGISSVFQRRNQRKRAKSEPCLPDNKET